MIFFYFMLFLILIYLVPNIKDIIKIIPIAPKNIEEPAFGITVGKFSVSFNFGVISEVLVSVLFE